MVSHDDDNKGSEGSSSQGGEKRCFDLFATLLLAFGDDETRARRGKEEQERKMLMIQTITTAATNAFLLGQKRKIDDDQEVSCKNQENTSSCSSSSLVEYKRRRVVEYSDDEPIRAQPNRAIKASVKKRKGPVKQKEPVRREPMVTPGWLVELMSKKNGVDAKLVIEKVITMTDLKPDQGRFLIPFKQITEDNFLTKAELKIVKKHQSADGKKGDRPKGLDVVLLNSNNVEEKWNANLRIWDMKTTSNYALCCGWNLFVRENDLQVNQTRSLWSFHSRDGKLYLAFDPLDVAQDQDEEDMSLAMVPFSPAASSSPMAMDVISEDDPFACEEINRSLVPYWTPRRSRTPRVWIPDQTSDDSRSNLLEGLDLNRTPPPEDTEMDFDLEAAQETSQESLTETSVVFVTEMTTVDLELRL